MTDYYAKVNIFSAGVKADIGPATGAFIEGNGRASSNDLDSLHYMAKDLVEAVDRNNERVYKLIR